LENYVAGQPFPLLDPNDPQVATRVMWNFSFRPQYTDDVDIRDVEAESYRAHSQFPGPIEHFTIGHFAFYNNIGRTDVPPVPTDPEANGAGIRYRFGAFPFIEPAEIEGFGLIRPRNKDPDVDDNVWFWNPGVRMPRRVRAGELSDAIAPVMSKLTGGSLGPFMTATYASNLDPDSYFGFSAKIENYNYKLLGIRPMLLCPRPEYAGQALPVRQQDHGMSGSVGDAPALCDRGDRKAALVASENRQQRALAASMPRVGLARATANRYREFVPVCRSKMDSNPRFRSIRREVSRPRQFGFSARAERRS
jgi:uncharacterized protein DUF1329